MLKILVIADVHGEFEKFSKIIESLMSQDFDFVLCPGDFTDMYNVPEGYSQFDIAEIVIQKLLSLNKPVFCVPGNHDPYELIELFEEYGVNLHEKVKKANEKLMFIGFGGAATPFNTKFEPTEEEIEKALEKQLIHIKGKKFILLTHNPPFGTKLDKIQTGEHVGSTTVRKFIEKEKPMLAISAHIHEAYGIDKFGQTTLFYPGPSYEGFYGIVEIDENIGEVKCIMKKV
jgi:Icc-related predicted phosphoesterase